MHELRIKSEISNYAEYLDLVNELEMKLNSTNLSNNERMKLEAVLDEFKDWKPTVAQTIKAEGKEADIL